MKIKRSWLLLSAIILFALGAAGWQTAQAAPTIQGDLVQSSTIQTNLTNEDCLACHAVNDIYLTLEDGSQIDLTVLPADFNFSAHGKNDVQCTDCHTDISEFPHPEVDFISARQFAIEINKACDECHTDQASLYHEGKHSRLREEGIEEAALCSDCHGSHTITSFGDDGVRIAQTCRNCHSEIYDVYKNSVHGNALLNEENNDVPVCSDCHENHNTAGPSDEGYILHSPQVCGTCHADAELMNKYDVRTGVFDTYVADFHGTTIAIFDATNPGQETNKPVCSDCHGVHNILPPDDENSAVLKANLSATCERCHEGASEDFSDAWLSHYRPDMDHSPAVYIVDVFYKFLIPGVLGGMALFIATDIYRHGLFKKHHHGDE